MTRGTAALVAAAILLRAAFAAVFLRHPLSSIVPEDTEAYRTLARALATGDWDHAAFAYLGPLYAFVLAPFAGLSAAAERAAVTAVQIAMEAASVALLLTIGTRLLSRPAGLLAGASYAVYGIAVYYSAVLLPVTVMVLLALAVLAAALAAKTRPPAWWMLPGALVGLLALARPNAIVWLPVLAAWTVAVDRARAWRRLAALAAGLAVVLVPAALRSAAAGGGPTPLPVNGGINFYIGNHAAANGMYVSVEGVSDLPLQQVETSIAEASRRAGRPLDARSASAFWMREGLSFVRQEPAAAARLAARKAAMIFRAEEIPLNTNYAFAQRQLPLLRATLGFGLVMPLAAAGVVALLAAGRGRDPDVWLLLLSVAAYAASVAAFFVSDRYRMPLVPLLLLLAAHGAWTLVEAVRARRAAVAPVVALAASAVAVNWPMAAFTYPEYAKDYFQLGKVHRARGDRERALALYEQAAALAGEEPDAFVELAGAYYFAGRTFEAERALRQALRIGPQHTAARRNLATLLKEQGLYEEASAFAVDDLQRASIGEATAERLRRAPNAGRFAEEQYALGLERYGQRKLGEARYAFKRAVQADPDRDAAHFALALVAKDLRLGDEACAAIAEAAALRPADEEYRKERALLCGG